MKFSDLPVGAMWRHSDDYDVYIKLSVADHIRSDQCQNVGLSMGVTSFGQVFTTDPESDDIELVETL